MSGPTLSLFVWYTISSGATDEPLQVNREQLKSWLADAGIDPSYLPARGRAIDAFRLATGSAVDDYDDQGTRVRLSIRETTRDDDYVTRAVFQTWTDIEGIAQERKVASLQFYRPRRTSEGKIPGTERMRWLVDQRLKGHHRRRVEQFVERLVAAYELNKDHLSAHAVRTLIRSCLMDFGAVAMAEAGGGAYLIDPDCEKQVRALQRIVRRCGPQCRMRVIPVPDDEDSREMVAESVDTDIANRARQVIKEITDWTATHSGQAPTTPRWASWMADCRVLQDRLVTFLERFDGSDFPAACAMVAQLADLTEEISALVTARLR